MGIQWQVRAVNRQVVLHQETDQFKARPCPGLCLPPEKAVVHNEQISPCLDREPNRGEGCIHCSGDPRHGSVVGGLEAVRSLVVIRNFPRAQQPVAVGDEVLQECLCHGRSQPETGWVGKAETNDSTPPDRTAAWEVRPGMKSFFKLCIEFRCRNSIVPLGWENRNEQHQRSFLGVEYTPGSKPV